MKFTTREAAQEALNTLSQKELADFPGEKVTPALLMFEWTVSGCLIAFLVSRFVRAASS